MCVCVNSCSCCLVVTLSAVIGFALWQERIRPFVHNLVLQLFAAVSYSPWLVSPESWAISPQDLHSWKCIPESDLRLSLGEGQRPLVATKDI